MQECLKDINLKYWVNTGTKKVAQMPFSSKIMVQHIQNLTSEMEGQLTGGKSEASIN